MGAEVILCDGFEVVPPPEIDDLIIVGNDEYWSYYAESSNSTEEDGTLFSGESSSVEEEQSGAKPLSFYFVKHPVYDDPEIKAKIDDADMEIYQCNKIRIDISNAQKFERAEVKSLYTQMETLASKWEGHKVVYDEKMRKFDPLVESLRNLWCSSSNQLCFSKDELDHLIYRAHYHIEHGNNGLEDEDWVGKKIGKPDGIVLSEDSLAEKEASIHRLKSMAVELHDVKKELDGIAWKTKHLNDKVVNSQNNIKILHGEMVHILEKRDIFYERIKMLRLQRDKGNALFFKSLAVMRKAKKLVAAANVKDLERLASSEVNKFMDQWNEDKAFRDDYVKIISASLFERQLSRDGRVRDTEAQVVQEKQVPVKTLKRSEEVHKTNKEDSSSNFSKDVFTDKPQKAGKKEAMNVKRSSSEESDVIDLEFSVYEKPKKKEQEVDPETMKKMEREQQLEKARLAMERKRKQQEKAAAKAAVRAQKEAEKKLKECEKKAQKKAAANSELNQSREVKELEKVDVLAVSAKDKQQKERSLFPKQRSFRYKHRGRGTEALPKVILNRRKAQRYWFWGISSAALAVALFLVYLILLR